MTVPEIIKQHHTTKMQQLQADMCDLIRTHGIKSHKDFIDLFVIPGFAPIELMQFYSSKKLQNHELL